MSNWLSSGWGGVNVPNLTGKILLCIWSRCEYILVQFHFKLFHSVLCLSLLMCHCHIPLYSIFTLKMLLYFTFYSLFQFWYVCSDVEINWTKKVSLIPSCIFVEFSQLRRFYSTVVRHYPYSSTDRVTQWMLHPDAQDGNGCELEGPYVECRALWQPAKGLGEDQV